MDVSTTAKLNNGVEIPLLGLGVFRSAEGAETADAVKWALQAGYVHVDTAMIYGNEKSTGEGLRASGIAREKVFVTTKLWNEDMRQHRQLKAFDESLKRLSVEYVDLYLVHWPAGDLVETWTAMETIYNSGRAKAIGVSNFQTRHLDAILAKATVIPAVNQVELHPYLTQEPLRRYCAGKGIAIEAWSPIGGQGNDLLSDPVLKGLSAKYGKSPAQIVLRWHLQLGIIAIPKSIRKERIEQNRDLYDFALTPEEAATISKLNKNRRNGDDPDNFDF